MLLLIGGLSSVFKSARDQQGKATGKKGQHWPGPVAGQPPKPRPAQRRPAQPRTGQPARPGQQGGQPWPPASGQRGGQPWPQPPGQPGAPWPQAASPYQPQGWPGGSPAPQPDQWAGEGVGTEGSSVEGLSTEGRSSEGVRSEGIRSEGRSSEGTSTEGVRSEGINTGVSTSIAAERARFREERAAFRQSRQDGGLHRFGQPAEIEQQAEERVANPIAAMVASREGLAQAVLAAEVLGKPRALRPYGRR